MSTVEQPPVGIVVVSHSRALGMAAAELAHEVVGTDVPIAVAAGLDDTTSGTDAAAIATAIATTDRGSGVVVLMDLGSAVLSAEMALDLLEDVGADPGTRERTVLCPGPLVEGLVVAAATASTGADGTGSARTPPRRSGRSARTSDCRGRRPRGPRGGSAVVDPVVAPVEQQRQPCRVRADRRSCWLTLREVPVSHTAGTSVR